MNARLEEILRDQHQANPEAGDTRSRALDEMNVMGNTANKLMIEGFNETQFIINE